MNSSANAGHLLPEQIKSLNNLGKYGFVNLSATEIGNGQIKIVFDKNPVVDETYNKFEPLECELCGFRAFAMYIVGHNEQFRTFDFVTLLRSVQGDGCTIDICTECIWYRETLCGFICREVKCTGTCECGRIDKMKCREIRKKVISLWLCTH